MAQLDDTKTDDRWYYKSNVGYMALKSDISNAINSAPIKEPIQFTVNANDREYTYEVIRVNKRCAWQRNTITNHVRPVILNYDTVKNEKDILNQKDSTNPFAASMIDQASFMNQKYQRFAEILPGALFKTT